MTDTKPDYYKIVIPQASGGTIEIDVIDIINALNLNFNVGNVLKYLVRCGRKTENRIDDLEKALEYLSRETEAERVLIDRTTRPDLNFTRGPKSTDRELVYVPLDASTVRSLQSGMKDGVDTFDEDLLF